MDKKPRILVVDDEEMNVKLLAANLIPRGYEVLKADNGEEALRILSEQDVDLVLLDVMMPGISGFEVTRRIRADERLRLVPVILITALKDTADRIAGIEAGCDDFISKPFDKNEVLARVQTLLKMSYYRALLDEKEKFEYVVQNMDNGIIVFNRDMKIALINKKAKALLMIDAVKDDFNFLRHIKGVFEIEDQLLSDRFGLQLITFELQRPETEKFKALYLTIRTSVIRNPAGEISSMVMIIEDITEKRKEEIMKNNFFSLISHKLRTPITVMQESVAMLAEGIFDPLSEKQKKAVNGLRNKTYVLKGLMEKLLGFTTVETGEFEAGREVIELKSYLPDLLNPLVGLIKDKQVRLQIDCQADDLKLNVNTMYLDLVLGNLAENAIKFNDKEQIMLTVSAKRLGNKAAIAVSDNGPGIPPEEQEKIFSRFYQIDKYFTGNVEGVGLGLALVKKIVEYYDGNIVVESQIGNGARFILTLPAG